ncbi:hypothetical protein [Solirubrobacter soli]|uniref:hypothetical protein n=1 Tax=Solirubrobacter soli TaxID=363832 RepID=UPI0003F65E0A|nr:hypothetical protein [Solirubrobacter soli]
MLARRLALTLTTAAALTAAGASVARADIGFLVMPGFSGVEIDGDAEASRLDLVRGGTVIASSEDGAVFVDELKAGDVARAYNDDGTPAGSVTYDGTPAISNACVGGTTFTATRGAAAVFQYAGAFTGSALEPLTGTWDGGQTAQVTLSGPLSVDDIVFVSVGRDDVDPAYSSTRMQPAETCTPHQPGATPTPTPGPGSPQPGDKPAGKLSLAAARAALARIKLTAKVPVTLPEPGRIDLRLVLKSRTIAHGARTASGATKVTLKLKHRLKRGTKVTLRATFTPSRAGAEPQRASVKVTLTGSSSRA